MPDFQQQKDCGNVAAEGLAQTQVGVKVISVNSMDEAMKIATGEANADSKHLTVPLYMPLENDLRFEDALKCVSQKLHEDVTQGDVELIAIAMGWMTQKDKSWPLQLVLYRADEAYMTYSKFEDEFEMAVLMDGDGRRYLNREKLPLEEALRQWIAGFVNWNCEVPGLYRLQYALISPTTA